FDDILTHPSNYGITNTTTACLVGMTACSDPDKHFYYFNSHPSDVSHHIVGNDLFTEVLAPPSPVSPVPGPIVGAALPGLILACGVLSLWRVAVVSSSPERGWNGLPPITD